MRRPVKRQIDPHAARLRRERTDAEDAFWQAVRNRQIDGFRSRFQHSLEPYIADFACLEPMLIVEIDGGQHSAEADRRRTAYLESLGFQVLRFWNNDVLNNLEGVITAVQATLAERAKK